MVATFVAPPLTHSPNILVRRYFEEIVAKAQLDAIDVCVAPNVIFTDGFDLKPRRGRDALKQSIEDLHRAFGKIRILEQRSITHGQMVATRWLFEGKHSGPVLDVPATNLRVHITGMAFCRLSEFRIAEVWVTNDLAALARQIGAEPQRDGADATMKMMRATT